METVEGDYKIAVGNGFYGGVVCEEVHGYKFRWIGIHENPKTAGKWIITHLPSGLAIGSRERSHVKALKAAERLDAIPGMEQGSFADYALSEEMLKDVQNILAEEVD